ncbi:Uncharacterised protein [Yersinia frederiksenii]|uniref:Uncharacterized protein n=1 Tax=Yersinia frederiksenii TaxID=29484 RepID=A0AAI8ZQ19_YERFR|nr:Uncharacterised protein [Yersinia frederiksenii]CQR23333.1 Uncharacterised protein [Yersinia enterocolitica]CFR15042.1 Uncharacterised protein [Yersinia frederiksenii]CNL46044.1 Uncharacterised protein [Yersinia frederiksenii]CQH42694.1 Uncharacterised protein [Yersinia frederiksenii]
MKNNLYVRKKLNIMIRVVSSSHSLHNQEGSVNRWVFLLFCIRMGTCILQNYNFKFGRA